MRLAGDNNTASASASLDSIFIDVAETALENVDTIAKFRKKSDDFPGILRWAFGEKITSKRSGTLRPLYDELISDEGKKLIAGIRDKSIQTFTRSLRWKFLLLTTPLSILLAVFANTILSDGQPASKSALYLSIVFVLVASFGAAQLIAHFYAAKRTEI